MLLASLLRTDNTILTTAKFLQKGSTMAKNYNRTSYKMSYNGFEGVNTRKSHSGNESISMLENFRLGNGKTLEKRCGYIKSASADVPISQAFRAFPNGTEVYYLLCENIVFKYTPHDDAISPIYSIDAFDHAYFFEYLGNVYLCTDKKIYEITENSVEEIHPYIPLYGKDWPSSRAGEQYEELNILCNKVAISYKFVSPSHGFLSIGDLKFAGIEAIYRNGELLSPEKYHYDDVYNLIAVSEHEDDDEFVAIIQITHDQTIQDQFNEILKTKASSVFYELNNHNLLLWGNSESNKIYYSKTVDPAIFEFIHRYTPNYNAFYIPPNSFFKVNKQSDRVKAIIRHYDRVLIMTDTSTWMTDLTQLGQEDFQLKSINASLGCKKLGGAIRINNSIISLGGNSAFCWETNTDELNECNAYSISESIRELLPKNFFDNCIITVNHQDSEVWFHNASSKITWIYNTAYSAWYKYTGFEVTAFLESDTNVIFAQNKSVYRFDKNIYSDDSSEITAVFKSGHLEFNTLKFKKFNLIVLRGEFSSGKLTVKLLTDNTRLLEKEIDPPSEHSVLSFRIRTGSFKTISVELCATGIGEQRIHSMDLYAN